MTGGYAEAVVDFKKSQLGLHWANLPFFADGAASRLGAALDNRVAGGAQVLPPPQDVFAAFRLTGPDEVRVVILGQDPYPTPGDAHGLAFSVSAGVRTPRSLANIFRELKDDLGHPPAAFGELTAWARQGVLLLNTCLTVDAGMVGSHRNLWWSRLTDDVIRHLSARSFGVVFILWGADAQRRRPLIDETRHLVIATAHPSPLSARRGFFGSRPFSRTNDWLAARGQAPIDWRL